VARADHPEHEHAFARWLDDPAPNVEAALRGHGLL
jgi:hypothetical protein